MNGIFFTTNLRRLVPVLGAGWLGWLTIASADLTNAVAPAAPVAATVTNVARQLKPFVLKDLTDAEVKSATYDGKALLVFFFATWAKPCADQLPSLIELQRRYGDKEFSVLGIALDEQGGREARRFVKQHPVNFPVLLGDLEVVQNFGGVTGLPTLCLVDRNRVLLQKYNAVTDTQTLEDFLKIVLQK